MEALRSRSQSSLFASVTCCPLVTQNDQELGAQETLVGCGMKRGERFLSVHSADE